MDINGFGGLNRSAPSYSPDNDVERDLVQKDRQKESLMEIDVDAKKDKSPVDLSVLVNSHLVSFVVSFVSVCVGLSLSYVFFFFLFALCV